MYEVRANMDEIRANTYELRGLYNEIRLDICETRVPVGRCDSLMHRPQTTFKIGTQLFVCTYSHIHIYVHTDILGLAK